MKNKLVIAQYAVDEPAAQVPDRAAAWGDQHTGAGRTAWAVLCAGL